MDRIQRTDWFSTPTATEFTPGVEELVNDIDLFADTDDEFWGQIQALSDKIQDFGTFELAMMTLGLA